MLLNEIVLGLLLNLPGTDKSPERLQPMADAISEAAEASPLFEGEAGAQKTAFVLVAIASHESALRESVRTCKVKGDGGHSISAYQLHGKWAWGGHSPEEICSSDALQASLALRVLHRHSEHGVRSLSGLMRAYASGNAATHSHQARELEATYRSVVLRAEQAP